MSQKLTPNLDQKSTDALNLTVLQRIDPLVKEILLTVCHVALYEFNVEWRRKNVEGSLFVVKRDTTPRFQFIVMNRKSVENLVEDLLEDFEYEVNLPYILYRNASQDINGMWFFKDHDCEKVANLFSGILPRSSVNSNSKVLATNSKESPTKSKFEELEAFPSLSVKDGPLEPPSSSINTNNRDIQTDPSLASIFNPAMKIGGSPNATISEQSYNSIATVVSTSSPQGASRPTLPTIQIPSKLSASGSIMSILETSDPNIKHSMDLVTPSLFTPVRSLFPLMIPPISPSIVTAPSLNNTLENIQRTHGAPFLHSFPPPTPPSLTPTSLSSPIYGPPVISREKVREALQLLIQDKHFIDMVYQAVMNAHQT